MKEGKFKKWKRRFSESLLRLGSSSGSLENRSPSRSPSAHISNSTNRPRSLVRGIWHGVCGLSLSIHALYVDIGTVIYMYSLICASIHVVTCRVAMCYPFYRVMCTTCAVTAEGGHGRWWPPTKQHHLWPRLCLCWSFLYEWHPSRGR